MLFSCQKSITSTNHTITYKATTNQGVISEIYYSDKTGSPTNISVNSGIIWQVSFTNEATLPRILQVAAGSTSVSANTITSIYVDNVLVKSDSGYYTTTAIYNLNK